MSDVISHTARFFPHETLVSHCARTDSNRRPLGSKPQALLHEKAYSSRCFREVRCGKSVRDERRFMRDFGGYVMEYPTPEPRVFTCPRCLTPFTPTAEELQELEALELLVGLDADKVSAWCEKCQGEVQ